LREGTGKIVSRYFVHIAGEMVRLGRILDEGAIV